MLTLCVNISQLIHEGLTAVLCDSATAAAISSGAHHSHTHTQFTEGPAGHSDVFSPITMTELFLGRSLLRSPIQNLRVVSWWRSPWLVSQE